MGLYRKKPIVITAYRLSAENQQTIACWCGGSYADPPRHLMPVAIDIPTLEGTMLASEGDWIIQGIKGEFYPCKHEIFEETYEVV